MLVLGIVLLVVAVVVIGYVSLATIDSATQSIDLWVVSLHLNPFHLFLLGIATAVVLQLGIWFTVWGMRRNRRRERELRELRARDPEPGRRPETSEGRGGQAAGPARGRADTAPTTGDAGRRAAVAGPGIDAAYRRGRGTETPDPGTDRPAPEKSTPSTGDAAPGTRTGVAPAPRTERKPQYDSSDDQHAPPVPPRQSPDEGEDTSGFTRGER